MIDQSRTVAATRERVTLSIEKSLRGLNLTLEQGDRIKRAVDISTATQPRSAEPHQFAGTMLIPDYCVRCNVHRSQHA